MSLEPVYVFSPAICQKLLAGSNFQVAVCPTFMQQSLESPSPGKDSMIDTVGRWMEMNEDRALEAVFP
jgi:hypothetical protein